MRAALVIAGMVIAAGCADGANIPVYSVSDRDLATRAPGASAGYLVTAHPGDTFRITWSGHASFSGSIRLRGHFLDVQQGCFAINCTSNDGVSVGPVAKTSEGESFGFTGAATDQEEGIQLTVDSVPVYLDLAVDGARRPDLVGVPGATATVTSDPFGIEPFSPPG